MAPSRPDPRRPPRAPKPTLVDALQDVPAASQVTPPGYRFPGERQAHDPWLDALMAGGREFWRARGVAVPGNVAFEVADNIGKGAFGRAFDIRDPAGPRMVLDGYQTGKRLAQARNRKRSVYERRYALKDLAATVYHELGHTASLPHSPGGLMDELRGTGDGSGLQAAASLVRRLIPREKR